MVVFIVTFCKRIGRPHKQTAMMQATATVGKDSDFVFICNMNVCSYILHVKITHI